MNKSETFASRLERLLQLRNITKAELSRRTGISRSSITHYVKGDWEGKQDAVYAIAEATGVNEAWLMGYDVPMCKAEHIPPTAIDADDAIIWEAKEDEDFLRKIQPYLSKLEPLSDNEAALKTLLNSIGFDIIKTRGNYFFTHEHGGSEISTDDLNELLSCAQNGLKIAAKTLELKLMRKAFGPHYPAKIIIPPPSAPQADTDTTNEEPTLESLKSGE